MDYISDGRPQFWTFLIVDSLLGTSITETLEAIPIKLFQKIPALGQHGFETKAIPAFNYVDLRSLYPSCHVEIEVTK